MKSFLPNDIKDNNRKVIFDILLHNPELAKVEITQKTTMSFVTVSKIVDFFEEIGILSTNGACREGSGGLGRKRVVYSFEANSYVTIGVQIIGKKITAVLVNLYGEEIANYTKTTDFSFYDENFIHIFEEVVENLKDIGRQKNVTLIGIGIGIDGAINRRKKTIRMRTKEGREEDYNYEEILNKLELMADLPIVLENDVNASAFLEFYNIHKKEVDLDDLLMIALGEGIGAGIILNKRLYRGYNAGAGELEYMCFDSEFVNKPSAVGWLESKLGLDYLTENLGYTVDNDGKSNTMEVIDYVAKKLAMVITNIISILDIHTIILSGKTICALPEEIVEVTKRYVSQYTDWNPDISISVNQKTTAMGAGILAMESEMTKVISK